MDMYNNLLTILEDEIRKIVKDGEVTSSSLCNLDTLVDVIKDVHEIKKMESENYDNSYSGKRYMYDNREYDYGNRRYDGRMQDGYIRYDGDMYYGRDGSKQHMMSLLEQAMESATNKDEKDEIMKMINKMK